MKQLLLSVCVCFLIVQETSAQMYAGPFIGFKYAGLKGTFKQTANGQTTTGNVADGSKTGFTFGIQGGYQVLPRNAWYKLDASLEVSFTSVAMLEEGFNSSVGAGKYSASGFSGGGSKIISFDIMPIHRLTIPSFPLVSPYGGLGFGINLMSTSDITLSSPSVPGTIVGKGGVKIGLLIFYGAIVKVTNNIQPYLQFKHLVPFGSETEFTESGQLQGYPSGNFVWAISDVPSYFSMTAGVRYVF